MVEKVFQTPKYEIVRLNNTDIIATSGVRYSTPEIAGPTSGYAEPPSGGGK